MTVRNRVDALDLQAVLERCRLVDLSQPLGARTVLWPGSRPLVASVRATVRADGHYLRDLDIVEHCGTHLDAPAHFVTDGAHVDDLTLEQLVRPLVVLDVRALVGDDPDFTLSAGDVERIEERDGMIPAGVAVAVCTGWDRFVDAPARYIGVPGPNCPGIGVDAAELCVARGVVGVAIDTRGIDPGHRTDCPAHHVTLGAGLWHLEGVVGLHQVPSRGARLFAAVLPLVDGSGAPARVFALVPAE